MIFTKREYPFELPVAQQLHQELSNLFPTANAASLVAARAGLATSQIYWEQPVFFIWKDILEKASAWQVLRKVVEESIKLLPPGSPAAAFLQKLLSEKEEHIILSVDSTASDGTPAFILDNDHISEPEALLYQDDLTMQIGRIPKLVRTLNKLMTLAPSVCRLTVSFTGGSQYGTAFRIGERALLTNWHVLHRQQTGIPAIAVTAEFGYDDNGEGGINMPSAIPCDTSSIVSDRQNDWAIIQTQEDLDASWAIISLTDNVLPVVEQQTFIIQHPLGDRKRIGFVRNQISAVGDRVVHYLTDTQAGSSGAPVFDDNGQLLAIHHAGGRAQEVAGRPPIKKNEGIRISRVLEDLRTKGVPCFNITRDSK